MHSFLKRALVAAVLLCSAASAHAAEIFLQSGLTGEFVRVRNGTMSATGHADNSVRFELIRLEGNRVAFRAPDGSYLRAGIGQQTRLATGSQHIRGWETFEMVRGATGVSLKSVQNGKYVTVDNRTGQLSATANRRSASTVFHMPGTPTRGAAAARTPEFEWSGDWSQIWLASANGRLHRPPAGSRVTFSIDRDMGVTASMGCNQISTRLSIDGQRARYSSVMTTRVRCSNEQQGYETGMGNAFAAVRAWEFREGQIVFMNSAGQTVLQIGR